MLTQPQLRKRNYRAIHSVRILPPVTNQQSSIPLAPDGESARPAGGSSRPGLPSSLNAHPNKLMVHNYNYAAMPSFGPALRSALLVLFACLATGPRALAQITQVGTSQTATGTNTVTINKPAGLQVGDVMLATISYNETSNNIDLDVAPTSTGWTLIQDVSLDIDGGDDEWRGAVFYKVAVASDLTATNYLFDLDDDTDGAVGAIVAFTGVDASMPFDVAPGTLNVTNSTTITANSITTTSPNTAIIMLAAISDNNTVTDNSWTTTSPGALTELFDANTPTANQSQVAGAWAIKATTGVTGNGTATQSGTDESGAILIALRGCPPEAPDCTTPVSPAIGQTGAPISSDLVWNSADCASTYDVYFGTSMTPPLVSNNQAGTTYDPGTLLPNTTYYWQIVPANAYGDAMGCAVWSFTTSDGTPGCAGCYSPFDMQMSVPT